MTAALLALLVSVAAAAQPPGAGDQLTYVVFVCEDGADESLVAAAYFNKLAAERGLAALASFRGVDPENDLSRRAVDGLKADGVPFRSGFPRSFPGSTSPSYAHRRDWRHASGLRRRVRQDGVLGRRASGPGLPNDAGRHRPARAHAARPAAVTRTAVAVQGSALPQAELKLRPTWTDAPPDVNRRSAHVKLTLRPT